MHKTIIVIAGCIVTLLLGYTGYRGYQVWKQNHWLVMARNFAAKGDGRNELLCLQQALRLNPRNLEACRLMANLADAVHLPVALDWRQRIVDLDPNSLTDRVALAQTAMNLKDFAMASNALAAVTDSDKKTAMFQNTAGVLATGMNQLLEAETHFAEAIRLDPANPVPEMNLAVLRLHGTDSLDQAAARIDLKRISLNSTNPAARNQAERELALDAVRHDNLDTALGLVNELVKATNVDFSDRLLQLELLHRTQSPEYKTVLALCEREAAVNATEMSDMANWLTQKASPTQALGWLQSLPMQTQTNQPAALLCAQFRMDLGDWQGLQSSLQAQNWGDLEYMRHALLARALRGLNLSDASTSEWVVALKFASEQKGSLISLLRLAAGWKWNSEAEQTLWIVVNRYPEEKWAPPVLMQTLMAGGRTRPLMQLFGLLSSRSPDDLEMKNNLAFLALLLGAQELNPYKLTQEVYDKSPLNPTYASTYAFSLYLQKQYAQALKVMQRLAPKDLENPSIAGYYGLILKANGNANSKAYLRLTTNARLLPEEQSLFQQAMMN
jgi:cytochrome c-type biogenesis protein CcmH/NrfG